MNNNNFFSIEKAIKATKISRCDDLTMTSYDLRSGFFNLIIGAIFANHCNVHNSGQIFRGYEKLALKLSAFGIEVDV